MSASVEVALPFWLDRPELEAVEIAVAAERAGATRIWVGEMASFDAFALATAIGKQTERCALKIGPLAVAVRSPVAIALGVSSVAALTGRAVDIALGSSSPAIVAGWHDRDWSGLAGRMEETVHALRAILKGERSNFEGTHVRTHGYRLRHPLPKAAITVAAFGPAVLRVAARSADEVVLNLVTPKRVAEVRTMIEAEAARSGRTAPRLAVWIPVALDPGPAAREQLAGQLSVYLAAPGYAEQFCELGFDRLVQSARTATPRRELTAQIPLELAAAIGAIGSAQEIAARTAEYRRAGADTVAIVPSTAEDPAGRRVLASLLQDSGC